MSVRLLVAALIAASIAVPAAAQAPLPSAGSDGWTVLHEVPLNAKVEVVNPTNDSVTGTVSYVDGNRVTLSSPRFQSQWLGQRPARNMYTLSLSRADVSRVSVVKMPRRYKTPDAGARPATVSHFVATQEAGVRLRVKRSDGTTLRGTLASHDNQSLTLIADKTPTPVSFGDVREIERLGGWTTTKTVSLVVVAGVVVGFLSRIAYGSGY